MRQLIVNADDYGRSPGVSEGIRKAYLEGIVTSTTCMMNLPNTAKDIELLLEEAPDLQMGVHLVLTMGSPLLPPGEVPSLVNEEGQFFLYDPFLNNLKRLKLDEAEAEWRGQIEAFIRVSGRKPTHLDSHHHSSFFSGPLFELMLDLAGEFECAIRNPVHQPGGAKNGFSPRIQSFVFETIPSLVAERSVRMPDNFEASFYDETATIDGLSEILTNLAEGVTELMCHPGYADEVVINGSGYSKPRERELKILISDRVKQIIEEFGVELISFEDI